MGAHVFQISGFCAIASGPLHLFEPVLVREQPPLAEVEVEEGEHDQGQPHDHDDGELAV